MEVDAKAPADIEGKIDGISLKENNIDIQSLQFNLTIFFVFTPTLHPFFSLLHTSLPPLFPQLLSNSLQNCQRAAFLEAAIRREQRLFKGGGTRRRL